MSGSPAAFEPTAFNNDAFQTGAVGYGGGHGAGGHGRDTDLESRVHAHWDRVEALEAKRLAAIAEMEARERALYQARGNAGEKPKAAPESLVAEREAIQREIAEFDAQAFALHAEINTIKADISRMRAMAAAAAKRTEFIKRRNAALALLLIAA